MEQSVLNDDQQKWVMKLLGYDFEIQYRPGKENRATNALSRQGEISAISIVQPTYVNGLMKEVANDPRLQALTQDLMRDPSSHPGYQIRKWALFYKGRLVVPRHSPLIPQILREMHCLPIRGHSGFFRTYKRISGLLFWDGQKHDIRKYVASCETCQRNKYDTLKLAGLLQPLPIPTRLGRHYDGFH